MIAVDTNILVYAHHEASQFHKKAKYQLTEFANSSVRWGIPVFCIGEFLRVITHPKVFSNPYTPSEAIEALARLVQAPTLKLLYPSANYLSLLASAIRETNAAGNLVFDAQIVAVCRENGVTALLTEDQDFDRFHKFTTKRL